MNPVSIDSQIAASFAAVRANVDGPNFRTPFEKGVRYLLGRRLEMGQVAAATDRVFDAVESAILRDASLSAADLPRLIRRSIDSETVRTRAVTRIAFDPRKRDLAKDVGQLKANELRALREYYYGEGRRPEAAPAAARGLRNAFFRKCAERVHGSISLGKTG